jgi:zinc protease
MRVITLLVLGVALAAAQRIEVRSHTLANGMKLLIHEDHDIPNVALYFFFKVGSRNERPGTTGLSHFFEHMMFNGAKKYGPKQFDIQMEASGGNNNAYTSRDVTVYTDWFPRGALELMMDMESDRIRDLSFDPKIIESERGVVASERRLSVENSNSGALEEQLDAAAYTAHPYGWPVIGWMSDIESWTMEDLRNHFRVGYAPNNCVVVVAGDVNVDEVEALGKKYLEPIPRHDPPPPVRTREPQQQGERRVILLKAAQLPLQMYSFHVPQSAHLDSMALEVLGTVLTGGRSSRLYSGLVDRGELALSVSHSLTYSLDPGQMNFQVQPRAGVDPVKAEQALYEELERVRSSEVPAEELQKAKNQLLADFYRSLKTIAGKANLLGDFEVFFGDYRRLNSYPAELEKVTAADVLRVARQYLGERNRTVATLIPEPKEASK